MTPPLDATVMVSGCFDLLHTGHIAFLEAAACYGRLHVALGSDRTITRLKGHPPVCNEVERLYHVRALKCVSQASISVGDGLLDFEQELRTLRPTTFVVNQDGDSAEKRTLCRDLGVRYRVLERLPHVGLPMRSSTTLRQRAAMPYRLDLAGGWLDQPEVSSLHSGSVIVTSIVAEGGLQVRSGLASSTRATACDLWGQALPAGEPQRLARQLFACENPPGTSRVSGSQDALGIVLPGVNRLTYTGDYWPAKIESLLETGALQWLESVLFLKWLGERPADLDIRQRSAITPANVRLLVQSADDCWSAIVTRDVARLGRALSDCSRAQANLFPASFSSKAEQAIDQLESRVYGAKLAGAGGAGYLIVVAAGQPTGTEPVCIRRADEDRL